MLEVKDLHKSYGEKEVLKGVDLTVADGEIKGLIGINGAGKSTLVEVILGVKKKNSGSIFILDRNVSKRNNRKFVRNSVGYMPQTFSLFNDLTVKENLDYLSAIYKIKDEKIVNGIIKICGLEEKKDVIAEHLSGGYRQLLSMAGAIINLPKFLILDEPTAAMDPIFRKQFWNILKHYKKAGATILIITHYMEELVECDSFSCLSNGKISFSGSVQEFKKDGMLDIESLLKKYCLK